MQEQLDRIEADIAKIKQTLLALLDALEDDYEEDEPSFDLDGVELSVERDGLEPL